MAVSPRAQLEAPASVLLDGVFRNLPIGVIACDRRGRILFHSPEAERILGPPIASPNAADWIVAYGFYRCDRTTPFPADRFPLERAFSGQETVRELMFVRNRARPGGAWIEVSGTPLRDGADIRGAVIVFADVSIPQTLLPCESIGCAPLTATRGAGPAGSDRADLVCERLARFRSMYWQLASAVEQTADSILITDSEGVIQYVNPAFETITGYTAAEVLGHRPAILKSHRHDREFYRKMWDELLRGESFHGTIINRKKSGELFWSEQTITPIKNDTGATTHYVSVLKDMTGARKLHEQEVQMAFAREVQQRFYQSKPSLPGFDIAAAVFTAAETGGDYFDFIPLPDGSVYIAIADIAGHGFGSALVMAEVRTETRVYAPLLTDISSILATMNQSLRATLGENRFVTMLLAQLDPARRLLRYASAGHETGFLLGRSGEIKAELASTAQPLGAPAGLFASEKFEVVCAESLESGDTILLATDGLADTVDEDDNEFGSERALDFIRAHLDAPAAELADGLYAEARRFAAGAPQSDDILYVICKVA